VRMTLVGGGTRLQQRLPKTLTAQHARVERLREGGGGAVIHCPTGSDDRLAAHR
jgi:hypothetical protein